MHDFSQVDRHLHQLIDPTNIKKKNYQGKEVPKADRDKAVKNEFVWMSEHQTKLMH